jgi:hypothetical protein
MSPATAGSNSSMTPAYSSTVGVGYEVVHLGWVPEDLLGLDPCAKPSSANTQSRSARTIGLRVT